MAIVMVITKVILDICKHRGKKNLGNERDGTGDWVGANRLGGQERPFEEVICEFSCEWKAGLASWMAISSPCPPGSPLCVSEP